MSHSIRTREVALVGVVSEDERVVRDGVFPLDPSKRLPLADVVLLLDDGDSGAMLFRYTAHGELAGDTWHLSIDDARAQAAFEYGDALMEWVEVTEDATDAHHFAMRYAFERLNSRGSW